MTAPARLRLSGRAPGPLGLLILAVLLTFAGAAWSVADRSISAGDGVSVGSAVVDRGGAEPTSAGIESSPAAGDSVSTSTPSGAPDAGLLPRQIRAFAGAVVLTALPSGSQPYWLVLLGLGLGLWGAAERNKLRPLCCGTRHGTRAPPARV